jgi:hypothetical protein
MREVYVDGEGARRKGERARRDIAEQLSAEAVGRIMTARLHRLQRAGAVPVADRP